MLRLASLLSLAVVALSGTAEAQGKPTIVLVHGAFAGSDSWNPVAARLSKAGYTVIAAANPLRSASGDASFVASLVKSISGPVVLVGHSYGGSVISLAAAQAGNVKALVYVAGFAPDVGESSLGLTGKFPGSSLGAALAPPVILADGSKDSYIEQAKFGAQFAADLPASEQHLMAIGQRPVREAALLENATAAAWTTIPSWFIYGTADLNIPPQVQAFMAERAHSKKTVVVPGASHVVMLSHPAQVAALIEEAARAK